MSALHETQGQAYLWAIFMLAGALCALLTDLFRLLALPCRTDSGAHTPIESRLSESSPQRASDPESAQRIPKPLTPRLSESSKRIPKSIIPYKMAPGIPLPLFPASGLLSGALSALIAAGTCFLTANGRMQPYMLLAMAAGAGLYHATFGRLLRALLGILRRFLGALGRQIACCRVIKIICK